VNHILRCHDLIKDDIIKGSNCYLFDKDNKRYVDFESGIWCTLAGHSHPKINEKIIQQINKLIHLNPRYTNSLAEDAAVSLLDTLSEQDGKCVFLSSGSEAVEFGINAARLVTGKRSLLTLSQSYLGAYGFAGMKTEDSWMKIDFDLCLKCEEKNCFRECENLKNIVWKNVAAFVFEPGCSKGMIKFPPDKLIDLIVKEVKRFDGLMVTDEVTTGLGRTGKWYGFNHYKIKPDIIAVGKGLGNGYPISAVAIKKHVAEKLEQKKFYYVQSHQNNPLGCVIASEVIKIIKEHKLVSRSHKLGLILIKKLNEIKNKFNMVNQVRGRGLMAALEFSKDSFNVEFMAKEMLKRGFIIGYNLDQNLIRFLPPITIEENEINEMVENLNVVLEKRIN
jgi:acetylornithine aminotransferase